MDRFDFNAEAIQFPKMQPWDFLHLGMRKNPDATQTQIMALAYPRSAWINWLYGKQRPCPPEKQERLHRIATFLGWLD